MEFTPHVHENRGDADSDKFRQLLAIGTFAGYVSEHPELESQRALDFISGKDEAQLLVIQSESGNGGTHLLSAIGNELLVRKIPFVSLSNGRTDELFHNSRTELAEALNESSFFLLDYFPYYLNNMQMFVALMGELNSFLKAGKKVVIQTDFSLSFSEITLYFPGITLTSIHCPFLSPPKLRELALLHVSPHTVNNFFDAAMAVATSNRGVVSYLVGMGEFGGQLTDLHIGDSGK